jgi:hypothetical protein
MCLSVFLEVKSCSKALLARCLGHGKSPYFSAIGFLLVLSPDYGHYNLANVYEPKFLECAF